MEQKVDILVIGAGPAGIISSVTARKYYPEKKIVVMKSVANGVIPCGIPYMFASLKDPEENKLGNAALDKNNIDVVVDEAIEIDREKKSVATANGENVEYDKLVLATGSEPMQPPIKGIDKKNVYFIFVRNNIFYEKIRFYNIW